MQKLKINSKRLFKKRKYLDTKRYSPEISKGLNSKQIRKRITQGKINVNAVPKTKSIGAIIKDNLFTLFNLVNVFLVSSLIYVGSSYKNMFFMGIVISNLLIEIVQEIRAKRATDKLSFLSAAGVTVRRSGKIQTIKSEEIVLDDIILYSSGKQVAADSIILEGGCEVNEAFLTGESEPVYKEKRDILYSGSFISSGRCIAQADAVGKDNASYEITEGAKKFKSRDSEIVKSLRKIIRIVSVLIIPLGLLFFIKQYSNTSNTAVQATEHTVAALIGMIPEGLILLTSTVLAVIVIKLAKRKVLVNELYSVEMLARTDVVCLDKTGTLTEGSMQVEDIVLFDDSKIDKIGTALASICISLEKNETLAAIGKYFKRFAGQKADFSIPFSSKKKYCSAYFQNKGAYILGAPEVVLTDSEEDILTQANTFAEKYRVLCLSESASLSKDGTLPKQRKAICLILLSDIIRPNARETVDYFKKQGVAVKIISGDNPLTVAHIAKKVGIDGWDNVFDMTTLSDEREIEEIADKYIIFGRTTPVQKQLLIKALRNKGHTVAMTGDGVNDVLAMKESDCSISVAQGTDAAKTVADIVLLNSSFEAVPKIVDEGRTAINNLQRTASLFLVKTIYSTLLTFIFLFMTSPYPFKPIQLTLIGTVSIGIPSFFLAFQHNKERVQKGFIHHVIVKAAPAGLTVVLGILATHFLGFAFGLANNETASISVIITGSVALLGVLFISLPLDKLRLTLVTVLSSMFFVGILFFGKFFDISHLSLKAYIILLFVAGVCGLAFWGFKKLFHKFVYREKQ